MTGKLFDLSGRVALVTGSSRGLGRAMAEGLAEAGATIVLNGADAQRLAAAAAEMPSPEPPYSSGIRIASQPASVSAFTKSVG